MEIKFYCPGGVLNIIPGLLDISQRNFSHSSDNRALISVLFQLLTNNCSIQIHVKFSGNVKSELTKLSRYHFTQTSSLNLRTLYSSLSFSCRANPRSHPLTSSFIHIVLRLGLYRESGPLFYGNFAGGK